MANAGRQLLEAARSIDRRFRMTSGFRSTRQQQALFAAWLRRGRTGLPVAPPGASLHERGLAMDISRGGDPFRDPALAALGKWWVENGLGWSPSDPVHFQLPAIREAPHPLALETSDDRSPELVFARSSLRSMGPPIDGPEPFEGKFSAVLDRQREALEDYRARLATAVPAGAVAPSAVATAVTQKALEATGIPGVSQLGGIISGAVGEVFGTTSVPLIDVTTGQPLQASREAMLAMGTEYRTRKLERLADDT